MENVKRIIDNRLKQHRDNLEGWSEGLFCIWCKGENRLLRQRGAKVSLCRRCNGSGWEPYTQGYLVPTEPDPEERELVRRDLKNAISELEFLKMELGL